jgi:L-ascorbate metabolism protein UlaG (beta-lactamase superfamily)
VAISRRTWLGAASLVGVAGAWQTLSLAGVFDHRYGARATDHSLWRSTFTRLERLGEYVNGMCPIGHSTNLMVIKGVRVLTDPWFFDPAEGTLCHEPGPAVLPEDIGPLHGIFISHDHGDHFDSSALKRLDRTAKVMTASYGVANTVRRLGYRDVVTLRAWESVRLGKAELIAVPASHSTQELGLVMRNELGKDGIYFAADTGFSDVFATIAQRYQPRMAILPVNGARTRWCSRKVMNVDEAMRAARMLGVRRVVPSHDGSQPCDWLSAQLRFETPKASETFAARVRTELPGVLCITPKPGDFVRV